MINRIIINIKAFFIWIKKILKSLFLQRLFKSNRSVAIISVLIAIVSWIIVSIMSTENISIVISNIPVSVSLSDSAMDDGLRIFSGQDVTASVTAVGSRIVVGQLTKNDIKIVAQQASFINAPGNYTLALTAKKAGVLTDYEILSDISPGFLNIVVDNYKEVEFKIEKDIKYTSPDEYYKGDLNFSFENVTISGPESEISKVSKIVAKKEFNEPIKQTMTESIPLIMQDKDGNVIKSNNIALSSNEVDVTIVVLSKRTLNVSCEFNGMPTGIETSNFVTAIIPNVLDVAASEETFSKLHSIKLGPIDFSTIDTSKNNIEVPIILPMDCKILNDISHARVSINTKDLVQKEISINKFSFINSADKDSLRCYSNNVKVIVVGPTDQIFRLTAKDIEARIDMSGKESMVGYAEMPLNLVISNHNACWVYGKYKVIVGCREGQEKVNN